MKKQIAYYEERANRYLELLETSDGLELDETIKLSKEEIQLKIKKAKKRIEELVLVELEERIENEGEISITDPDAKHIGVSNIINK